MSNEAITWSLRIKLPPGNALAKQVLFILANQANGDPARGVPMLTHPSNAYIVETTGQDRKTVIENMKKLVAWGLISDTGKRCGRTGQVVIYEMHTGPDLLSSIEVKESQKRNGSKSGTVSKDQGLTGVTVPRTVPSTGHGTYGTLRAHISPADASDFEGTFEGHEQPAPPAAPTEAGAIAAELRSRGYSITSQAPGLIAAVDAGVTLALVLEFAEIYPPGHPKCAGSGAYIVGAARRQILQPPEPEQPDPSPNGAPRHASDRRLSAVERVRANIEAAERRDAAAGVGDIAAHALVADG